MDLKYVPPPPHLNAVTENLNLSFEILVVFSHVLKSFSGLSRGLQIIKGIRWNILMETFERNEDGEDVVGRVYHRILWRDVVRDE